MSPYLPPLFPFVLPAHSNRLSIWGGNMVAIVLNLQSIFVPETMGRRRGRSLSHWKFWTCYSLSRVRLYVHARSNHEGQRNEEQWFVSTWSLRLSLVGSLGTVQPVLFCLHGTEKSGCYNKTDATTGQLLQFYFFMSPLWKKELFSLCKWGH